DRKFAVRESAERELLTFGSVAGPALRRGLSRGPTLEARRRIEGLLKRLSVPTPEQLRERRAVRVLEAAGRPEARRVLERLAGAPGETMLTQEARAGLLRLDRRPPGGR